MDDHQLVAEVVDHMTCVGITLDNIQSLLVNRHGLAAYCSACRRWADLDLARLVDQGHGGRRLRGLRPRCRACGEPGQIQVRPPMPSWPGGVMYVGTDYADA